MKNTRTLTQPPVYIFLTRTQQRIPQPDSCPLYSVWAEELDLQKKKKKRQGLGGAGRSSYLEQRGDPHRDWELRIHASVGTLD